MATSTISAAFCGRVSWRSHGRTSATIRSTPYPRDACARLRAMRDAQGRALEIVKLPIPTRPVTMTDEEAREVAHGAGTFARPGGFPACRVLRELPDRQRRGDRAGIRRSQRRALRRPSWRSSFHRPARFVRCRGGKSCTAAATSTASRSSSRAERALRRAGDRARHASDVNHATASSQFVKRRTLKPPVHHRVFPRTRFSAPCRHPHRRPPLHG